MKAAMPKVTPTYVGFNGGLDAATQRLPERPGFAQAAMNYEPTLVGGYRRVGGYERMDGRARPSDAQYELVSSSTLLGAAAASGAVVTGATSGALGTICYRHESGSWVALTARNAAVFVDGEALLIAAASAGKYELKDPSIDAFSHNEISALASGIYRTLISAPPGSGLSRIASVGGVVYAVRNNAGGTAAAIYKATATGWQPVGLNREVSFTAGSVEYAEGSVLSKGGVTATVLRVIANSGAWAPSNTAAGRMVISSTTGGEFTAGVAAGGGAATLAGASTAITLAPGGKLRYDKGSFVNAQERIYCCDGVNREFEFDGVVMTPIVVPNPIRATSICVHGDIAIWGCGAELVLSSTGSPYEYDAITGSSAIGAGSRITNLLSLAGSNSGKALLVTTDKGALVLYGSNNADFTLVAMGLVSGAADDTAQAIAGGLFADGSGIRSMASVNAWGNFSYGLSTQRIGKHMAGRVPTCSVAVSDSTLYRIWFTDGTGLTGTLFGDGLQWMPVSYGIVVRQMISTQVAGKERIYFTSDDGMVYEADAGRSFDGGIVEALLLLHPFSKGNPTIINTWRGALLEASGESAFALRVQPEYDYADSDSAQGDVVDASSGPVGMRWDVGRWDSAVYDGGSMASMRIACEGEAASVALAIYSSSANEMPHTLSGCGFMLTSRKIKR